jgi:hypothetical protein
VISVATPAIEIEIPSRSVGVSNPDKIFVPTRGETKRVPEKRPEWLETVRVPWPVCRDDVDHSDEPKRVAPSRARKETP